MLLFCLLCYSPIPKKIPIILFFDFDIKQFNKHMFDNVQILTFP